MGAKPSMVRQATPAPASSSPPSTTGLLPYLTGSRTSNGETMSASSSSPWTDLDLDLVDLVLRRLPSHTDRVRFAAVCRHWRYAAREHSLPRLPPPLPWISFPSGVIESLTLSREDDGKRRFFPFWEQQDVCYGCFGNWQLFKEAGRRPGRRHYLRNTLSGATVRLPGRCEKPLRLNPDGSHGVPFIRRSSSEFEICKVIVCSNDLIAAIAVYRHRSGPGMLRTVVVCCPGMWSWSRGLYSGDHSYKDMAFYKGKIYAVTNEGHLFAHEVAVNNSATRPKPRVYQIKEVIPAPSPANGVFTASVSDMGCYLVISKTGKLLMVRWVLRYGNERVLLKVFEADLETSQWLEVKRLDGEVLFVSRNCSEAISADGHGGSLRGNRIYLVDNSLVRSGLPGSYRLACVYYMRSKCLDPISLGHGITYEPDATWLFP